MTTAWDRYERGGYHDEQAYREAIGLHREAIVLCPVCSDIAPCALHPEEPSLAERQAMQAHAVEPVISTVRSLLNAWDASDNVPPRLSQALADLSDALAKYDGLPF